MQKKTILILLLTIIGICSVSCVSAVDDAIVVDAMATDDSNVEVISADLDDGEDNILEQSDEGENLAVSDDDSILSRDASDEPLSVLPASFYTIDLKDSYEISSDKAGKISYYMKPCTYMSETYHFYLRAVDLNGNMVYNNEFMSTTQKTAQNYAITIPKNTLAPGTYVLGAVNYDDSVVMDTAVLKVSGTATITASDYRSYYYSGAVMTVTMTDQVTGKPLTSSYVAVKFTNTKTKKTVTRSYLLNSNGQASFTPPVGVGTWTVQFSSGTQSVVASAVQKTATITKGAVKIKAYNVKEYKGFKTTLKAKVTSNGKNVNEGKVKFKINGKTYKANVKNGIATKKVKLKKVKSYKYTAQYGADNFKTSKKVKAKAVLKNRVETKIVVKDNSVYTGQTKKVVIKVLTKSGKKVKDGKLKIRSLGKTTYSPVKNGKVLAYVYSLGLMKHFKGFTKNGEKYKKSITNKAKIKYIPTSHKYKASKKSTKITSKFKCLCGKTGTHYHYRYGYFYTYKYKIAVI